jgi:putative phosphoesterase
VNVLTQLASGLLGSSEAVTALAAADTARLLVFSDSHGHYSVVEAIIREFGPAGDALLFAGDGMWDIVQFIENAYVNERFREALPPVVAFVAGNGDGDQYRVSLPVAGDAPEPEDIPGYSLTVPSRQIVRACGYGIFLTHGHRHSVDISPEILVGSAHAMDCDIAVYGHTHIPFNEEFSHILALNPGSPSRPRGHSEPSIAIVSLDAASTVPRVEFYKITEGRRGAIRFRKMK